ncbi:MAG TPA: polymer-forming cytoskeletal protein [Rhizomicrobium sp.]|nr:polymer-forming cytoskeletal protein [Rhizomicrobium sp.]
MTIFNRPDKPAETTAKPAATLVPTPVPATPQAKPQSVSQPLYNAPVKGKPMATTISKSTKITGQLESTEDIQIDGEIDGDVRGVNVKVGNNAKVKGTVFAEEVELAGSVDGKIEAKKVIFMGTARMTGDVVHQDVKIESGAFIDGHLKPEFGKTAAKVSPILKSVSSSPAAEKAS